MSPTRELAVQVADEIKKICEGTGIHVVTVVGGLSSLKQERLLSKGPEVCFVCWAIRNIIRDSSSSFADRRRDSWSTLGSHAHRE